MTAPTIRGDISLHAAGRYTFGSGLEAGAANTSGVVNDAVGEYTVTLGTAIGLVDAVYNAQVEGTVIAISRVVPVDDNSFQVFFESEAGAAADPEAWTFSVRRINVIG